MGAGGDVLPTQEEPHEVLRTDRLYLAAKAVLAVAVDAGEEVPSAPLLPAPECRVEAPSHCEALRLEAGEPDLYLAQCQRAGQSQAFGGRWSSDLEVAADRHCRCRVCVGSVRDLGHAWHAWDAWQAKYPAGFLQGYSVLLRVKLIELRHRPLAAAKLAEAFATAVPQSSYAPQLLDTAAKLLANVDPAKSKSLHQLLKEKYPEDPLSQN